MREETSDITALILESARKAREETSSEPEPELTQPLQWPLHCTVGPGLEGAIACESRIGYVNGAKGCLIYRGYDIFDLCAHSCFEEVSYLLLHSDLPNKSELAEFQSTLRRYAYLPETLRRLVGFPIEEMNTMAVLRLGTELMRQEFSYVDQEAGKPNIAEAIGSDEDSIPMETKPTGEPRAIYEFKSLKVEIPENVREGLHPPIGIDACYRLIAGVPLIAGSIARIRSGHFPLEPDPTLSYAGNFLYMLTGRRPTPVEERVMDVALILHADHCMNASTFATMVVASTLSDIYFSVGAGIAALNGPLHGGANEQVLYTLREIGNKNNVKAWFENARAKKQKIMGFGHRVYKAHDPRARVLGPLARYLAKDNEQIWPLFETAEALEKEVVATLGKEKKIFPNVDFYSGLVYASLGIQPEMFTPIFAVSRVSGWVARVLEYLQNNRIFRPRAMYVGEFGKQFVPIGQR